MSKQTQDIMNMNITTTMNGMAARKAASQQSTNKKQNIEYKQHNQERVHNNHQS